MKEIKIWETSDGKQFTDPDEAILHEIDGKFRAWDPDGDEIDLHSYDDLEELIGDAYYIHILDKETRETVQGLFGYYLDVGMNIWDERNQDWFSEDAAIGYREEEISSLGCEINNIRGMIARLLERVES